MSDCERFDRIAQEKWATVRANRSGRSYQKSNCEQITQVAHDKWATVSDSLRLLTKNEQMSDSLNNNNNCFIYVFYFKKLAIRSSPLFKWAMWANRSGRSPKMSDVSKLLRSLTIMSDHEQFAQVAHQKWTNEQITWFFERIAHWLIFRKNEHFAQKTDERIPSPVIKLQYRTNAKSKRNIYILWVLIERRIESFTEDIFLLKLNELGPWTKQINLQFQNFHYRTETKTFKTVSSLIGWR